MRRLLVAIALSFVLAPAARGQEGPRDALAELDARIGESLAALERAEADHARAFLADTPGSRDAAWAALCHSLMISTPFLFVE